MSALQTLPQIQTSQVVREKPAPRQTPRQRDHTIDTLRGLAIFTMIAANLAAPVLAEPHPFWFRVYGSIAAPVFVTLSGMMVAAGTWRKGYALGHFVARGAFLLLVAALLDALVWDSYPFLSMDVLYLLGVSLPLTFLTLRLSAMSRWLIVAAIFLAAPLLQLALGYADYPKEVSFVRGSRAALAPTDFLHHWLVDGWFPLFPWLGFSVLGVQLAELRSRHPANARRLPTTTLWCGWAALSAGAVICCAFPVISLLRAGYSELFYPPTLGFEVCAAGGTVVLLTMIDRKPDFAMYRPLQLLGTSALTVYVLHLVVIHEVVTRTVSEVQFGGFTILYAGMTATMLMAAAAEQALKTRWRGMTARGEVR